MASGNQTESGIVTRPSRSAVGAEVRADPAVAMALPVASCGEPVW